MTTPGQWISKTGVLWAMDEAQIPDDDASVAITLVALARFVDDQGRGARPSRQELARIARKSVSQVHRDLVRLRELELIRPGDQSLVSHIRADRRPVVYDLAYAPQGTDGSASTHDGAQTQGRGRRGVGAPRRTDDDASDASRRSTTRGQRRSTHARRKDPEQDPEQSRAGARSRQHSASAPAPRSARARPVDIDTKARRLNDAAKIAMERYGLSGVDALELAKDLTADGYVPPEEWTEQAWTEANNAWLEYREAVADDPEGLG